MEKIIDRDKILADIFKRAEEAVLASAAKFDPGAFTRQVVRDLDQKRSEVVWKLLGLDNRWGKWEVDHCNGRSSPITQYLSTEAEAAVRQWVQDSVIEVVRDKADQIKRNIRLAIEKEIDNQVTGYKYRETIDRLVSSQIKPLMDGIMAEVLAEAKGETP